MTDNFGNLYIAARGASLVLKVNAAGVLTIVAGTSTSGFSVDGAPATSSRLSALWGMVKDASGNLFISDTFTHRIRRVDAVTGILTTVAGDGTFGFSGDGGPATNAQLASPDGIAIDRAGNLFIADTENNRIRRVDAVTGIITTVAGNGNAAFSGDGGLAVNASLNFSQAGVAVDRVGNLFIADAGNNRIRRVDASTGIITTVAGNGKFDFTGDGGPATHAALQGPFGAAVDGSGNLFIADTGNNRIRRVDASTGIITTVAGSGPTGFGIGSFGGDGGPATSATFGNINGVTVDAAGNLFIADSPNRIRRVDAVTGRVNTVAGTGVGDGDKATNASLFFPEAVAKDANGNLLIIDTDNHRIRRVDVFSDIITTVAGNGQDGFSGDHGPAINAAFSQPGGLVVDNSGNYFIADTSNNRIRRVDALTGIVTTVAGTGSPGFSGDGGPATNATFSNIDGVTVDASGTLFIADAQNNRIRRVDALTGIVTTVAGNGTASFTGDGGLAINAGLNFPASVAVDRSGNLTIADSGNNRIRRIDASTGIITSVAGNGVAGFAGDGGPATHASLKFPRGISFDRAGNLFIADASNRRVRVVHALTGVITTVAGNGAVGFSGDGGPATSASLTFPVGATVDNLGNLFIADTHNNRIRRVTLSPAASLSTISLSFGGQFRGTTSSPQAVTLTNDGSAPLAVTGVAITGINSRDFAATTSCRVPVAVGSRCTISITFTPTALGPRAATLVISDDAPNSPQTVSLNGTGTPPRPTVSLSPSALYFFVPSGGVGTQTVTLKNTGFSGPVSIKYVTIFGSPLFAIASNTCGGSLAQGASCQVSVRFYGFWYFLSTGTLLFVDDGVGSPQGVFLTGYVPPPHPF
jgi:sugar lactone lactonase YvrE